VTVETLEHLGVARYGGRRVVHDDDVDAAQRILLVAK